MSAITLAITAVSHIRNLSHNQCLYPIHQHMHLMN